MRDEISKTEIKKFNRYGAIFSFLLILCVLSAVPLAAFLGYYGLLIFVGLFIITMYFALKIEKIKKKNNIHTFKEIVSFTEGMHLDEIEKAQEFGKLPYQNIISVFASTIISCIVSMLMVWLFKTFILI